MVGLPVHPRLARMVVARPDSLACVVAAVVEERDVLRGRGDRLPADLALRVAIVCGHVRDDRADRRAADRVRERAADIARRAGVRFDAGAVDPDLAGVALLAGFPDRLAARRRTAQFQLRNGTGAWVADDDPLAGAPFVVAADLDGKRSNARIRLGAAVDATEIAPLLAGVIEDRRLEWDDAADDLVERVERRLDALRLGEERRRPAPGAATTDALVARVRTTRLAVLPWTPPTSQLRARMAFLRATFGDEWPDVSDAGLLATLDVWLAPYLAGAVGRADLDRLDLGILLRSMLPWPLGADLDELAPRSWTLPTGREARDRLRRGAPDGLRPGAGRVRRAGAPDDRPGPRAAHGVAALARRPPDPGHRRSPRLLDRLVGRRAQGPRRPLPQAPLAGGPGQRTPRTPQAVARDPSVLAIRVFLGGIREYVVREGPSPRTRMASRTRMDLQRVEDGEGERPVRVGRRRREVDLQRDEPGARRRGRSRSAPGAGHRRRRRSRRPRRRRIPRRGCGCTSRCS